MIESLFSVFHNRLAMKMKLQSDPRRYETGSKFDGNLKKRHLKQDSNYNSYLRVGLPPTPISNPEKDAQRFRSIQPSLIRFTLSQKGMEVHILVKLIVSILKL